MQPPMPVLVVGSIALDSVRTPAGEREEALGGSAAYFGVAASPYASVRVVAVVGTDFPDRHLALFRRRGHRLRGVGDGRGTDLSLGRCLRRRHEQAHHPAHRVERLRGVPPGDAELPTSTRPASFSPTSIPALQLEVLDQMDAPPLVVLDTMNYWITSAREKLLAVLRRVHVFLLNDEEAQMLTGADNVLKAAEGIRMMGPSVVVIKRGEHGALARTEQGWFALPAFPLESPQDPTGRR